MPFGCLSWSGLPAHHVDRGVGRRVGEPRLLRASVVAPPELRPQQPAEVPDCRGQTLAIRSADPIRSWWRLPTPSAVAGDTAVTMCGLPFPARADARGRTWTLTHAAAGAS